MHVRSESEMCIGISEGVVGLGVCEKSSPRAFDRVYLIIYYCKQVSVETVRIGLRRVLWGPYENIRTVRSW